MIKTVGTFPAVPSYKLLELNDNMDSGWFYPRMQTCSVASSEISADFTEIPVYDFISVTVENADVGDVFNVWFMLEA